MPRSLSAGIGAVSPGRVIAVGSGKGGVGKSTIALGLARALRDDGFAVGVLDADLYGPDIPLMLGVTRTVPADHLALWQAGPRGAAKTPPYRVDGLSVMSMQFLIAERQTVAMPGPMIALLVSRLWTTVDWGDLDYLIVDLPPGTGDIQQAAIHSIPIDAAIVVVTPQDVAHLDAKKLLEFLALKQVPVLGAVENMSGVECPHCHHEFSLFTPAAQSRAIWADGVARLAVFPFEEAAVATGRREPTSTAISKAFRLLANEVLANMPPKPSGC